MLLNISNKSMYKASKPMKEMHNKNLFWGLKVVGQVSSNLGR